MAEPIRKRNKDQGKLRLASLQAIEKQTSTVITEKNEKNPLIFWSLNTNDPYLIDLTEFSIGRTSEGVTRGKHKWAGDFRGRPSLIAELVPAIKCLAGSNRARSLRNFQEVLRFWWRLFDEAESVVSEKGYALKQVESVADIQLIHHDLARKKNVPRICHGEFVRIANFARQLKKLPPLHWPSIERSNSSSAAPEMWEIERIRHELKRRWFCVLNRWQNADKQEANLWGWKELSRQECKNHTHQVYRAVIELTGNPIPTPQMVEGCLGYESQVIWMQPYSIPIAGLYPTGDDVRAAFALCLLYSGWNISTLADLSVDGRFVEAHPTNPDYHVVYGFKPRGQSEHACVGRNKRLDAPGTILRALVERTRPLRRLVKKELYELEARLEIGSPTSAELNYLLTQRNILVERARSPWLFVDHHKFSVRHLTAGSVNLASGGTYLKNIIRAINRGQKSDKQVSESIALGDLRDSYIGFAYEFSNYSILTAQMAAGHKSTGTTQNYLRHRQWKSHSAKQINKFQNFLFAEIDERQSVDPTILRALMEWGGIKDEERDRLAHFRQQRTRIGVLCKDPSNPPRSIARDHNKGSCRIQRCTLCPDNAILLPDSYNGIAMRVAELEFLRGQISVTTWVNSSFPDELANAESALSLYDGERVSERLKFWRTEIQAGRFKPVLADGSY